MAFYFCDGLTNVTIGNGVISIGGQAFRVCFSLTGAYFRGNAPAAGPFLFEFDDHAAVYYLPGTTGWGVQFAGRPTAPWFLPNPLILEKGQAFGVQSGGFGFTISWATNASVVVESCTNLANPAWSALLTNTLTAGSSYFRDSEWTNHPSCFYRLRWP